MLRQELPRSLRKAIATRHALALDRVRKVSNRPCAEPRLSNQEATKRKGSFEFRSLAILDILPWAAFGRLPSPAS